MTTPTTGFQLFARTRRVRLTTFAREGTPVAHPSAIAVEGDHAYVCTPAKGKQNAHLDRYPEVEIRTPVGTPMKARARRLHGSESRHAALRLARRHPLSHGIVAPLGYRLMLDRPVHYELRLVGE